MLVVQAGIFDGWGAEVVGSGVGGVLGGLTAVLAIWLTRRFTWQQLLQQEELRAVDDIVIEITRFAQDINNIPTGSNAQWNEEATERFRVLFLSSGIRLGALRDPALRSLIKDYRKFVLQALDRQRKILDTQHQASAALHAFKATIRRVSIDAAEVFLEWRMTQALDESMLADARLRRWEKWLEKRLARLDGSTSAAQTKGSSS